MKNIFTLIISILLSLFMTFIEFLIFVGVILYIYKQPVDGQVSSVICVILLATFIFSFIFINGEINEK